MANELYDSEERTPLDYGTLTVSSTAVGLDDASPAIGDITTAVKRAVISCESNNVRWRADGTAPTSSEGHLLQANGALSFMGNSYYQLLRTIQFICVTSDAALKITYFD